MSSLISGWARSSALVGGLHRTRQVNQANGDGVVARAEGAVRRLSPSTGLAPSPPDPVSSAPQQPGRPCDCRCAGAFVVPDGIIPQTRPRPRSARRTLRPDDNKKKGGYPPFFYFRMCPRGYPADSSRSTIDHCLPRSTAIWVDQEKPGKSRSENCTEAAFGKPNPAAVGSPSSAKS